MQLILKVASRCNLNCSYCYVYNKGDTSWRDRPAIMSDEVFTASTNRAAEYCRATGEQSVLLSFHGGEPCLVGAERFSMWCHAARDRLSGFDVAISIQTNGTLIDQRWLKVFREHSVGVGVSIDGPAGIHDRYRVDHAGRGSHGRVTGALAMLRDAGLRHGLLCVIPLGSNPVVVHRHFASLGAPSVTYLFPDYTHDTIGEIRGLFGKTPCADFLIGVFDEWWSSGTLEFQVRDLWNMARVILGGDSQIEMIGNPAPLYFFVEADGTIEGLDALRVCENGIARTTLNVLTAGFEDVRLAGGLHSATIYEGMPLPERCRGCPEEETCAGGYLPHRYSRARAFNNESVWCADLKKLFAHIRVRLGVTTQETAVLRQAMGRQTRANRGTAQ
jgi:uncharacterized protein